VTSVLDPDGLTQRHRMLLREREREVRQYVAFLHTHNEELRRQVEEMRTLAADYEQAVETLRAADSHPQQKESA
jgi:hypothetical protein